MPLKIGTRGSKLALAQAEKVAAMLQERGIGTSLGHHQSAQPIDEQQRHAVLQ
jgi:porphobilinogen deaminase